MKLLIRSDGGFLARNLWSGLCSLLGRTERKENVEEQEAIERLKEVFVENDIILFLSPLIVSHDVLINQNMSGLPLRVGSESSVHEFSYSSPALTWLQEQVHNGKLHVWEDQTFAFTKSIVLTLEKNSMWVGIAEQIKMPGLAGTSRLAGDNEHIDGNLIVVECNLDDQSGEGMGYTMERLLQAGARDVFYTPIIMKKNRPAYCLTVLCDEGVLELIKQIIFLETTTFGVRYEKMSSHRLGRSWEEIASPWGRIRIKWAYYKEDKIKGAPEYEDCRRAALAANIPLRTVYQWAERYVSHNKPIV